MRVGFWIRQAATHLWKNMGRLDIPDGWQVKATHFRVVETCRYLNVWMCKCR